MRAASQIRTIHNPQSGPADPRRPLAALSGASGSNLRAFHKQIDHPSVERSQCAIRFERSF